MSTTKEVIDSLRLRLEADRTITRQTSISVAARNFHDGRARAFSECITALKNVDDVPTVVSLGSHDRKLLKGLCRLVILGIEYGFFHDNDAWRSLSQEIARMRRLLDGQKEEST